MTSTRIDSEKVFAQNLARYGFKFVPQFQLPLLPYRFDFFLPEIKMIVEINGAQHFRPHASSDKWHTVEYRRELDEKRRMLVWENGFKLLDIDMMNFGRQKQIVKLALAIAYLKSGIFEEWKRI